MHVLRSGENCGTIQGHQLGDADRRNDQHDNDFPALGRDPPPCHVHQNRHRDRVPDDAQTRRLPPPKRARPRPTGTLGELERTLFLLDWLQDPGLRRKVTAGLNKGEARNTLARAVFFNRLGEIRDRSFEQQRYRASGLNLLTAAIVLWNTVYLDRSAATLTSNGGDIDPDLLRFLSPLGWEHINLTGDYTWPRANHIKPGKYRALRRSAKP